MPRCQFSYTPGLAFFSSHFIHSDKPKKASPENTSVLKTNTVIALDTDTIIAPRGGLSKNRTPGYDCGVNQSDVDPWGDGRLAEASDYLRGVVLGLRSELADDPAVRLAVKEAFLAGWDARDKKSNA
jgi:hypothetical protein